jgi:predicted nucleic acid-binding protein
VIVLDTNVVLQLTSPVADEVVLDWLDDQPTSDLAITSLTAAELLVGVAGMAPGRRRDQLAQRTTWLLDGLFEGRSIPFDSVSAVHFAEVTVLAKRAGREPKSIDAQIAAICRQYAATLATRNIKDFSALQVELVNPWERGVTM